MALLRSELVDLCSSPLSSLRLPADAYYVISSLGIASRRTHRGCRSGKSARRARAAKRFLPFGLINANSANNKFSVADGPDDARALCPEGFSSVQVSCDSVNQGGGVALLYRDSIVATDKHQCVPQSHPTTFEYMSLALTVNSVVVRLVVIYRPPKSSLAFFIQEFAECLELLSASTEKLLIMGDFNIHVDRPDSPAVVDATHIDGHTLDLVITRSSDDFIYDSFVSDFISDHFPVISVYNAAVTAGLDRLAPMKSKMCIVRPSSPWFSGEISAERRRCRKLERVWRRRRLTIDKDILLHHIRQLRKLMNDTRPRSSNRRLMKWVTTGVAYSSCWTDVYRETKCRSFPCMLIRPPSLTGLDDTSMRKLSTFVQTWMPRKPLQSTRLHLPRILSYPCLAWFYPPRFVKLMTNVRPSLPLSIPFPPIF
ncbi:hypothetical protein DAPPUDRAFT_114159 [Daphnia pulex]|uniref:Endonuclease/exonuclease/phosphatase domain-containing protein n=1 Tax=Daphnia pulex TaxID=6669 RepID=E9HH79_DAPPU|nr:hypothetical protein DAPPUDRAFT_114159 [Daphnia pulex]|eukprot:EFX68894.1 hypothetical protein DAPPUDRAFT_114159 [Daphnia pulex]